MEGIAIEPGADYRVHHADLLQWHRLRAEVFQERLGWKVDVSNGEEVDIFDRLAPIYLVIRNASYGVLAGCRLLPTTSAYMLKDVFPELLGEHAAPQSDDIWEVSRFSVKLSHGTYTARLATQELLIRLIAWGLSKGVKEIVTVTDILFERVLRKSGLICSRYRDPIEFDDGVRSVAGRTPVSIENLSVLIKKLEELRLQSDDLKIPA